MSFQVTVLKVLAGQPGGLLPVPELRRQVAILISSGPDWTDRTKRIAARAPNLDIFSQVLVVRETAGWRITADGRTFLASIETSVSPGHDVEPLTEDPPAIKVPMRLIGVNHRRRRRRRSARDGRPARAV